MTASETPTATPAVALEVVHQLFVLLKAAAVYGRDNEVYAKTAASALVIIANARAEEGQLLLEASGDHLFFNKRPIRFQAGNYAAGRFLFEEMKRRGVGAVEISTGCSGKELDAFVFAFKAAGPRSNDGFARLRAQLSCEGVSGIAIRPYIAALDEEPESADPACLAKKAFTQAVSLVEDVMTRARAGQEVNFSHAKHVVHGLADRVIADEQTLLELAAIHDFDEYTYAHSVNVSVYSIAIGVRLGLDRALLSELGFGGLFHDVGKVRLPTELINKPGALDEADWCAMRRHPSLGSKILLGMRREHDRTLSRAVSVAFEHHLGADGSGYPRLARPRRQDIFSRIVAIADIFDAISSGRVYMKTPSGPDEALRKMHLIAGTRIDAFLFKLFINAVGILPIGTLVLLDTGELGVVRRNDPADPQRPQVTVFADRRGAKAVVEIVDLAHRDGASGKPLRSIRRVLDAHKHGVDVQKHLGTA
ncbi:MAG: HD-GYP domain-containing protein [Elusimicrobiota bacterium]